MQVLYILVSKKLILHLFFAFSYYLFYPFLSFFIGVKKVAEEKPVEITSKRALPPTTNGSHTNGSHTNGSHANGSHPNGDSVPMGEHS